MRNLSLPDTQCGCESGDVFKCYCSELKENTPSKFRKRLSSCKNFIKNRSKKSYGNVINVDDEGGLCRSQSVNMATTYTIKKDLKDLLHITSSKKVLEPCTDLEDSQNSSSSEGSSKSASASSLRSSHESITSKQSSNGSIKSKRSSSKGSKTAPTPTPLEPERRNSRRDSNESIDARFEIILPS